MSALIALKFLVVYSFAKFSIGFIKCYEVKFESYFAITGYSILGWWWLYDTTSTDSKVFTALMLGAIFANMAIAVIQKYLSKDPPYANLNRTGTGRIRIYDHLILLFSVIVAVSNGIILFMIM